MTVCMGARGNTSPKAVLTEIIPRASSAFVPQSHNWLPFAPLTFQRMLDYLDEIIKCLKSLFLLKVRMKLSEFDIILKCQYPA